MIPKSFSASALQVAETCLARYKAEYIDRAPSFSGGAANVGIVCHGTLEHFVREYSILRSIGWDEDIFWQYFHKMYDEVFGSDRTKPEYEDARRLCYDWFHRPGQKEKLDGCKVLSVEAKNSFPMKIPAGIVPDDQIPTNYIMDRLDRIKPNEYRIVDYKSQRQPFTPAQMRVKVQPRLYALAVQIKFPEAEIIWVELDFLRHGPVAVEFRREDNEETYRMLRRAVRRIIETPDDEAVETLNPDCGWCVRKASCKTLLRNAAAGGIMGKTVDELAVLHNILKYQTSAMNYLLADVEQQLLLHAAQNDVLEFETDNTTVKVTSSTRRSPNHKAIREILGPELAGENGTFRVSDIDRLIKEKKVTPEVAARLRAAMPPAIGDPSIKVEMRL